MIGVVTGTRLTLGALISPQFNKGDSFMQIGSSLLDPFIQKYSKLVLSGEDIKTNAILTIMMAEKCNINGHIYIDPTKDRNIMNEFPFSPSGRRRIHTPNNSGLGCRNLGAIYEIFMEQEGSFFYGLLDYPLIERNSPLTEQNKEQLSAMNTLLDNSGSAMVICCGEYVSDILFNTFTDVGYASIEVLLDSTPDVAYVRFTLDKEDISVDLQINIDEAQVMDNETIVGFMIQEGMVKYNKGKVNGIHICDFADNLTQEQKQEAIDYLWKLRIG